MILLGTNVISEPWKSVPDEAVIAWLDAQAIETLFLSTKRLLNFVSGLLLYLQGNGKLSSVAALKAKCCPTFPSASFPSIWLLLSFIPN